MRAMAEDCQRRLRNNFPNAEVVLDIEPDSITLRGRHGSIPICPICGRAINLKSPAVETREGNPGATGPVVIVAVCIACQPALAGP